MSKKNRNNFFAALFSSAIAGPGEVEQLLAKGNAKAAVEAAKAAHKRAPNAESESLLVKAYAARISAMAERQLYPEANALLDMVWEKYPNSRGKLEAARAALSHSAGQLEDLLRPLNDPALDAGERARIEIAIQRNVTDLAALAECRALAPEHPLRSAAAALRRAFERVASGPVEDAELELPEVSRRGPLAPWKALVRAIASFYRREDEACERHLQAIPAESPCARLAPILRGMIAGKDAGPLAAQVAGNLTALQTALQNLDRALDGERIKPIVEAGHDAMAACRQYAPDLAGRLQREIAARLLLVDVREGQLARATGGMPRQDADYWLRCARVLEAAGPEAVTMACNLWQRFLESAVREAWFPANGPEAAVLYLHVAELLALVPPDLLDAMRETTIAHMNDLEDFDPYAPRSSRKANQADSYFLYPDVLYRKACEIDPHTGAFEQWLAWAQKQPGKKAALEALETWRRSLPGDLRPVLLLLESAENRKSLNKALALLDEAERIDRLSPDVRRARLRVLVAGAMRHLGQKKTHLAEKELDSLETLPQARENDRPLFLSALRWIADVLDGNTAGAHRRYSELGEALGSTLAAWLIVAGAIRACGMETMLAGSGPPQVELAPSEPAAAAVARICMLGDDMGAPIDIPGGFESHLVKELSSDAGKFPAAQLRALAEAGLRGGRRNLTFAATAAGLALGGDSEARFLFLRARTLGEDGTTRRSDCLAASAELARRQREMGLLNEIVEYRHGESWSGRDEKDLSLGPDQLQEVVAFERKSKSAKQPGPRRAPRLQSPFGRAPALDGMDLEAMFEAFLEDLEAGRLNPPRGGRKRRRPEDVFF